MLSGTNLRWECEKGANIAVQAKDFSGTDLRWAAESALKSGGLLTICGASSLSSTDRLWIAEAGKQNVQLVY
jgi:hypothetical protein